MTNFQILWITFSGVFLALMRIFLIALTGGFAVRRRILNQDHIQGFSNLTVSITLPCLIFHRVITDFQPDSIPGWWVLPLASVATVLIGLGMGALLYGARAGEKLDLLPVAAMHNANFLILPLGPILFPEQTGRFALYIFLYILGHNVMLWSLGSALISRSSNLLDWRKLVTPPFIANVSAITMVLLGIQYWIPKMALDTIALLGSAAVPVALFTLGATLGSIQISRLSPLGDILRIMSVKYIFIPVITVVILLSLQLHIKQPLLADFFVLQAASAPAVAIILQVRKYNGDQQTIGSLILVSYGICALAMPLWLGLWRVITG